MIPQAATTLSAALLPKTPENLSKLILMRQALVDKDAKVKKAITKRFIKYKDDPVGFVQVHLKEHLWSKQQEIMLSVRDNRKTAVPSCHDSGKSFVAGRIVSWWLSRYEPGEAFVVTSAPTFNQVRNILWREISRAHANGGLPGRLNQTEWFMDVGDGREEIVAFGRKPADYDPTAFQGIHARYVLVLLDEACGVDRLLYTAAETLVTNEGSRLLVIGNPDDPSTEFAQVCKPHSGWNVIHIDGLLTPNFTGEPVPEKLKDLLLSPTWVEDKKRIWGETSPLYVSKIRGKFPDSASDGLIPYNTILAAQTRVLEESDPVELGVDVARFGNDNTVMYLRKGPVAKRLENYNGMDTAYTAEKVQLHIETFKVKRAKIDDTGVGGGVTDALLKVQRKLRADKEAALKEGREFLHPMLDCEIVAINVGEAPITTESEEKFLNLRAELNWAMRLRFMDGNISLIEDYPNQLGELVSQAAQIKYERTAKGQLKIEAKKDMKERLGGRSPDDWDALVLVYAQPRMVGVGFLNYYAEAYKQQEKAA